MRVSVCACDCVPAIFVNYSRAGQVRPRGKYDPVLQAYKRHELTPINRSSFFINNWVHKNNIVSGPPMVGVWVKNTASLVAYDKLKTDTYVYGALGDLIFLKHALSNHFPVAPFSVPELCNAIGTENLFTNSKILFLHPSWRAKPAS